MSLQCTIVHLCQNWRTLTKAHSGKDNKISIDDYFHIEDQKEWTFFIGNRGYISPWWEGTAARILLSCVLMLGWPLRWGNNIQHWQKYLSL